MSLPPPDLDEPIPLPAEALFAFDSADITPAGEDVLAALLPVPVGAAGVRVDGYTDGVGSIDYNLRLSQRRADAVVDWLADHGVDRSWVEATGHGEEGAPDGVEDPGRRRVVVEFTTEALR